MKKLSWATLNMSTASPSTDFKHELDLDRFSLRLLKTWWQKIIHKIHSSIALGIKYLQIHTVKVIVIDTAHERKARLHLTASWRTPVSDLYVKLVEWEQEYSWSIYHLLHCNEQHTSVIAKIIQCEMIEVFFFYSLGSTGLRVTLPRVLTKVISWARC